MKKIKLLALDLDGTTLTDNNTLTDNVLSSIKKAIENNIIVVAASGRPFAAMPECITKISGVEYLITSNGSGIYDSKGNRIYSELLDENEVINFLNLTENEDLIFEAFINGLTYTDKRYVDDPVKYGCSEAYIDYVKSSYGQIEDMRKFIYEHRKELDSLEYVCAETKKRERVRKVLEKNTTEFFITSSSADFVEFMSKKATKANALEYVCNLLNIKSDEVSACGNADNDADMVEWAGYGAAVENASESCKKSAKIIVDSNNKDGVSELIEKILLINT